MKRRTPYHIRKVTGKGCIKALKQYIGFYCLVIPLKIKEHRKAYNTYQKCRNKTEFCEFGFLGKKCVVYTNGFTEHLRPMIPIIKDQVLTDCIKNPSKYLKKSETK